MDTREAILTRRTVHRFSDEPIPEGAVERALQAAVAAPNHKLSNPWRFTRVGPEGRQAIEDLYVRLKAAKCDGGLSDGQEQTYRAKVGEPAELVVVSQVLTDDDFRRREDYAATACAIDNLMLSLWNEGISSKWTTGSITRHPDTYELLGIDPDEERTVGFIYAGYPREDHRDNAKPPRKDLAEVVRETA